MKKMIVLYGQPDDSDAFVDYYEDVHLPIALKIPGLKKLIANRVTANAMGGEPEHFLIAELHFASDADFDMAMKSEQNMAAGRDLANFATGGVTVLIADETTLPMGEGA